MESPGKVNVWAELDGVTSAKIPITVKQPEAKITNLPKNGISGENTYILKDGTTHQLGIDLNPKDVEGTTFKWESKNENVATIDEVTGKITTLSEGETIIYYCAQIGGTHSVTDVFTLKVISVNSIEITNTTVDDTIRVGDVCNLNATVKPVNKFNQSVYWLSGNRQIATVNASGKVTCKNVGTVKIYAVSVWDSSIQGEITINVLPKVTGVTITNIPLDDTLYIGDNYALEVAITQRSVVPVVWSSSNTTVAEINPNTGVVIAKKAGTATITARIDNTLFDTFELKVKNGSVTILTDEEGYPKVTFNSQDKEWLCVNYDLINGDNTEYLYSVMNNRAERNLFKNPAEKDFSYKTYTDDEIKLLYSIDPYGVAHYVSHYAHQYDTSKPLSEILAYKDRIFKVLFGRDPDYFERGLNAKLEVEYYKTENKSNLNVVISESEALFGLHTLYDGFVIHTAAMAGVNILCSILNCSIKTKSKLRDVFDLFKYLYLSVVGIGETINDNFYNFAVTTSAGEISEFGETVNDTSFCVAFDILGVCESVLDVISSFRPTNFNKNIVYNYSANTHYDVYINLEKEGWVKVQEIVNALETLY